MEGCMFFMNDKTATDILNEGICFGIGEEKVDNYRDRLDEKEKVNENYI